MKRAKFTSKNRPRPKEARSPTLVPPPREAESVTVTDLIRRIRTQERSPSVLTHDDR